MICKDDIKVVIIREPYRGFSDMQETVIFKAIGGGNAATLTCLYPHYLVRGSDVQTWWRHRTANAKALLLLP